MRRRRMFALIAGLALSGMVSAQADQRIAGRWVAEPEDNVRIVMTATADGRWHSRTSENGEVTATIDGTYTQESKTETSGVLVFTPTEARTTSEHGDAVVETDDYELSEDGSELRLTSEGEIMVFRKGDR